MSHVVGSSLQFADIRYVFSNSGTKNKLQKTEMWWVSAIFLDVSIFDGYRDDDNNASDNFLHPIWQAHL